MLQVKARIQFITFRSQVFYYMQSTSDKLSVPRSMYNGTLRPRRWKQLFNAKNRICLHCVCELIKFYYKGILFSVVFTTKDGFLDKSFLYVSSVKSIKLVSLKTLYPDEMLKYF